MLLLVLILAAEACRHGEVVLSDGKTRYDGRVNVCRDGQWNTICEDYFWGYPEIRVICRQLGFLEDRTDSHGNVRTPGVGHILSEVECSTTERKLIECNYRVPSARNCTHASDARVVCKDGGTPTGLKYTVNVSTISLQWSASASDGNEVLLHYSVSCSGWPTNSSDLEPQHKVQVLVSNDSTWALLQGLLFNQLQYTCCVAANYQTFSPTVCISVNISATNDIYTALRNITESSTVFHMTNGITMENKHTSVTYAAQSNTVTVAAVASVLGIFLLIFASVSLTSWICTCLVYKKLSSKTLQQQSSEESHFDNLLYDSQSYSTISSVNGRTDNANHGSQDADGKKTEYEMVDLPIQAARRSMVKSQYEFSDLPNVENKETHRLDERYEFCEVNTPDLVVNESSSRPITENRGSNSKNTIDKNCCEESGYERLKVITSENPVVKPPTSIKLLPRESNGEGNYSATHVSDKDYDRVYSHTTPRSTEEEDHSYSHVWVPPQDGQPSPGYMRLDTTSPHLLSPSPQNSMPGSHKDSSVVTAKGYSYLNVSEIASQVVPDSTKHGATTGGYHSLDIHSMTSEPCIVVSSSPPEDGIAPTNSRKMTSSYSSLNIGEFNEGAPKLESGSSDSGYSHLNVYEEKTVAKYLSKRH